MEWGQQFMATLESLEMLGAFCWFLHLIKSNFLFSKDFYFLVWKMSGWGGVAWVGGLRQKGHHVLRLKTRVQTG